ncbi:hypothetical protein ACFL04_05080 [Patescibacteria group bacterium]
MSIRTRAIARSALHTYTGELNRHKPMTKRMELKIARQSQNGDEQARRKLICANLRFVFSQAKLYSLGCRWLMSDMVQAGNFILVLGCNNFSAELGFKYISYIGKGVKGAIALEMLKLRYVASKIPYSLLFLKHRCNQLQSSQWRKITIDQLAETFEVSPDKVDQALVREKMLCPLNSVKIF